MALSWRHHVLIQALLSRGPMTEEDFDMVFAGVSGKDPVTHRRLFNEVLLKINKELAYVQFELRACQNQYDGKVYYGMVNNVADEQSKLGTKYSVPQIAFYKGVVEAIVQDVATQGCISSIDALHVQLENQVQNCQSSQDTQSRIPAAFKSFTMSQKEKTLNDLIKDQWLCYTSDVCSNEGCTVRIHYYCLKKKFPQRKGSRACPGCGTEWPRSEFEVDHLDAPKQTQVPSADLSSRKRPRSIKAEAVAAVQSQRETQNEAPCGPTQRRRLRSCKTESVET
ncbi:Nse1 non-SMC component of SMC5-6 complex family protein [Musa troglodytarum]|uniref:Non-structural maintenance of chromosomes element 1 homolog n=1 Tax=Musa troglodytarum TaxID=320322 RepID=A0A9E7GP04_9LILI|nr:Nse1 non-SMC component of SMC5-6 complex family protein [Musa troglodytarum]